MLTTKLDHIDTDLLARWVRRRDQDPAPRVGDWLDMGDGVPRRIVKSARYHPPAVIANEVKPHTTFYFGDDGMKAGSLGCGGKGDAEIPWSRLTLVGVRRGRVRIPHHSVSWAAGAVGIDVSIECRVYRLTQDDGRCEADAIVRRAKELAPHQAASAQQDRERRACAGF